MALSAAAAVTGAISAAAAATGPEVLPHAQGQGRQPSSRFYKTEVFIMLILIRSFSFLNGQPQSLNSALTISQKAQEASQ